MTTGRHRSLPRDPRARRGRGLTSAFLPGVASHRGRSRDPTAAFPAPSRRCQHVGTSRRQERSAVPPGGQTPSRLPMITI
jgi:hypothetical protein